MEKLEITGNIRRNLQKSGNTVLITEFPTLTGSTPAAEHTKALLAALWGYASGTLTEKAANALFNAVKAGRLSYFAPYKMKVALAGKEWRGGLLLTLALTVTANGKTDTVMRRFLWTVDETLRKERAGLRARRRKARKNA